MSNLGMLHSMRTHLRPATSTLEYDAGDGGKVGRHDEQDVMVGNKPKYGIPRSGSAGPRSTVTQHVIGTRQCGT